LTKEELKEKIKEFEAKYEKLSDKEILDKWTINRKTALGPAFNVDAFFREACAMLYLNRNFMDTEDDMRANAKTIEENIAHQVTFTADKYFQGAKLPIRNSKDRSNLSKPRR
jgi:hypothetical protein